MTQAHFLGIAYSCGLAGTVLLWFFGLPRRNIDKDGHIHIILEQEDDSEKKQWKQYDKLSRLGIVLIGLSFLIQILSLGIGPK